MKTLTASYQNFLLQAQQLDANRFEIVTTFAFLIGIKEEAFNSEKHYLKKDLYQQLEGNKEARIIKNLCRLRTNILRNYKSINKAMRENDLSLMALTQYLSADSLAQLIEDGVNINKPYAKKPSHYIIQINKRISEWINSCRIFFPSWIPWQVIRSLFIMPDGFNDEGTLNSAIAYYAYIEDYPYRVYINFVPEKVGNLLQNDRKFVSYLLKWIDESKLPSRFIPYNEHISKNNCYDFLRDSTNTMLIIDSINSDPDKIIELFSSFHPDFCRRIRRILLLSPHGYDVESVASGLEKLEFTKYCVIDRTEYSEADFDINLCALTAREYYLNAMDSFMLISRNPRRLELITSNLDSRFLLIAERNYFDQSLRDHLSDKGICYCSIEDPLS